MPRYPNYRVRRRAPVSPVGTARTVAPTFGSRSSPVHSCREKGDEDRSLPPDEGTSPVNVRFADRERPAGRVGRVYALETGVVAEGSSAIVPIPLGFAESTYPIDPRMMIEKTLITRSRRAIAVASGRPIP